MIKLHNNNLSIVRGDTATLQINFSEPVDRAIFSVKRNINDIKYVFQKEITDGMLRLNHADTNTLQAGKYVYDIQVIIGEVIDTPIIGDFQIIADVTRE